MIRKTIMTTPSATNNQIINMLSLGRNNEKKKFLDSVKKIFEGYKSILEIYLGNITNNTQVNNTQFVKSRKITFIVININKSIDILHYLLKINGVYIGTRKTHHLDNNRPKTILGMMKSRSQNNLKNVWNNVRDGNSENNNQKAFNENQKAKIANLQLYLTNAIARCNTYISGISNELNLNYQSQYISPLHSTSQHSVTYGMNNIGNISGSLPNSTIIARSISSARSLPIALNYLSTTGSKGGANKTKNDKKTKSHQYAKKLKKIVSNKKLSYF